MTVRVNIVRSSELAAAGSWSVDDLLTEGGPACSECGLTVTARVETALLELAPPEGRDPLRRTTRRCRDRSACAARQDFKRRRTP